MKWTTATVLVCIAAGFSRLVADESTVLRQGREYTVAVYYWPNFHRDAYHQSKKGEGWMEWEIVKNAKPKFPGTISRSGRLGAIATSRTRRGRFRATYARRDRVLLQAAELLEDRRPAVFLDLRIGQAGPGSRRPGGDAHVLADFRARVKAAGFPDLHLNVVDQQAVMSTLNLVRGQPGPDDPTRQVQTVPDLLAALKVDSSTMYTWVHHLFPMLVKQPGQTDASPASEANAQVSVFGFADDAGAKTSG